MPQVANSNPEWFPDLPNAICLACQWEVVAAKPGNVHRSADFPDVGLIDFLHSGLAVSHVARRWVSVWSNPTVAIEPTFGQFILEAVRATRQLTPSNTNLGICLLLGPLAESWSRLTARSKVNGSSAPPSLEQWRSQNETLISTATVEQTRFIYEAIALAKPGGLGAVSEADVAAANELQTADSVAHVMELAADRDSIAAEFVSGFSVTFERTVPSLLELLSSGCGLQWAIVGTYLRLLAEKPDTLIARKLGHERATEVSVWARQLADSYFPAGLRDWAKADREAECEQSLANFDFALRSDGNRLNPGTTADLIAAGLFVALLSGGIVLPVTW
ncbi:MAG: triphosphoribosyl-dephospho-CoA synthase [Pirellulaceae bacterium]|nr:triphosphoribosyl-dephospho-CoA synthase [Pirellulaceae bacterium]